MKRRLAITLLSLVCCAANAEAEKDISVLCKGTKSVIWWPRMNTTSEPITTTYLFTFEKHSKKNNETFWEIKKNGEMGWVMQKNGERKKFQELVKNSPLLISFSILVSDHLVLLEGEFTNKYTSEKSKETINRLSGEWRYEATSYDKNKEPIDGEIERTMSITGTCGAAKPKF